MNLYEAISVRKSVHQFVMEPLEKETLKKIVSFYEAICPLFPGIRTEIGITEQVSGTHKKAGPFGFRAPYYLSIYSEKRDRSDMNAGFIGQQLCLYMTILGIGNTFVCGSGMADVPEEHDGRKLVIQIAFGRAKVSIFRRPHEIRRLSMKELCVFKEPPLPWMNQVLDAARRAPSYMNSQPWRFVVSGKRIHIFCRNGNMDRPKKWDEVNFGAMFANIAVVSDELWLDVDLIRLENISQKSFKVNQYVLSAVARTTDM